MILVGLIFFVIALRSAYKIWYFNYEKRWYALGHILIFFFTGIISAALMGIYAMGSMGHGQPSNVSFAEENSFLFINVATLGISAIGILAAVVKRFRKK